MADIDELTYTGLETKDNNVLVGDLTQGLQDIYSRNGEVLNFDSNTPDGQLIQLLAYMGTTIRELITEVYNSCDPDKCVGSIQDNRYQINYLERKQGSFTLQNITITTNQTVSLQGLDASFNDPEASAFAVSDNNGNIWYLVDSTTIYSGITTLEFRAKEKGEVVPVIGTITNQVTIVPGVLSVINNVGATSIGIVEESDSDFRIRRNQSVSRVAQNSADAIESQLLAMDGVVAVKVHQNRESTTDTTGTAGHTLWVIVEGGANTDIADVIYLNMAGADTRGNVEVPLTSSSLQPITIRFDRETIKPLYIKFTIMPITDLGEINQSEIKSYIAENLIYNIGEDVETSKVTQICADAMLSDGGNGYALDVQLSTGGTATASVSGTGITAATVIPSVFQDEVGDTSASYVFTYSASKWMLDGNEVNLTDYGISYTGTPVNSDTITIAYTAGTWTDYIAVSSLADKFTTDTNKIYITTAE